MAQEVAQEIEKVKSFYDFTLELRKTRAQQEQLDRHAESHHFETSRRLTS